MKETRQRTSDNNFTPGDYSFNYAKKMVYDIIP